MHDTMQGTVRELLATDLQARRAQYTLGKACSSCRKANDV